ncbi:fibrillin-2-like [Mercenaria mercenaria]|uniref:fibrillin-2-like n=1 Tax=Mercenaria mercenaria TaxID=6596 RepID=UPI00234EE20A|nr:fibrillin-2-like [Mercenaria mercenaria]
MAVSQAERGTTLSTTATRFNPEVKFKKNGLRPILRPVHEETGVLAGVADMLVPTNKTTATQFRPKFILLATSYADAKRSKGSKSKTPNSKTSNSKTYNKNCKGLDRVDIDECLATSPCSGPTAGCVNFEGSYSCTCASGWQTNVCVDVIDCPDACQGPSSTCVDFPLGSFTCNCSDPGYELAENKTTCIDIDECLVTSPCIGPTAGCVNSEGSYSCTCASGWQVNNDECIDEVDCPDACQGPSSTCVDLPLGSFTCNCSDPGYKLADNETTCIDIDECLTTFPCTGPTAGCVNSEGSYSCTCASGWQLNSNECVDVVDCPDACQGQSSTCVDFPPGSFTCNCSDTGYELADNKTTCIDIDECLGTSPCTGPTAGCVNSEGSYSCTCGSGWQLNIDECVDVVDCPESCQGPSSTCADLPLGSFTCNCSDPGFELDENETTCIDVVDCPDACQGPSSTCVDFPFGSFTCNCSDPGYELTENETVCIDIDECLATSPCTGPTAECVNSEGSYSCTCGSGWQLNSDECVDVVDCPDACQGPSSTCVDLPLGSFTCNCSDPGYKLADNETACIDIDECLTTFPCTGPTAGCVNSEGSYSCTCASGWQVNSDECADVVDCPDACQGPSSTCVDFPPGSFTCNCSDTGYELADNKTTCIDIDECLGTSPCTGPTAGCVNSEGSYSCTCGSGWQPNNDECVDVVDCPDACQGPSSTCVDFPFGSFTCNCSDPGYELTENETVCIDIDECLATSPCTGPTAECVNSEGSYSCTCGSGWQLNNDECVDAVDCPDACHGPTSTCLDFPPGSFTCNCSDTGYDLADNETSCIDIDECLTTSPCTGPTAGCVNSEGSYSCTCASGWQVNNDTCVDVVDCPYACQGPSSTCVDFPPGNFTCNCSDAGFELGRNKTTCIDIDECLTTSPCTGPTAGCVNSEGSYACTCASGWQLNNDECVDIVDCPDSCQGPTSTCVDIPLGSFTCNCSGPGYKLADNATICIDIDECLMTSPCTGPTAGCVNSEGSYSCTCTSGWQVNNDTCVDVEDCPDACQGPSSTCVDFPPGSFTCNCSDPGYELDYNETTCIDINECLTTSPCTGPTADCVNAEGSYSCTCDSGWQVNNDTCVGIIESQGAKTDCNPSILI